MSETEQEIFVTFDNNGNTLTDAQGRRFTWDLENRLVQAVVSGNNGGTTTFRYDPFGRRIQKSGPLGTTNYLYSGSNLIEEVDNNAGVVAKYVHIGKKVDRPLAESRSGTTRYYEQDGLASVSSLSDSAGVLAQTYTYDSYGRLTASTGTLVGPLQYTGREFDLETGIYYYRHRYYDENTGRFLGEDPIGFKGGIDFYEYGLNSPLNFNDPLGLTATCYWAQNTGHLTCWDDSTGQQIVNTYGYAGGNEGKAPGCVNDSDCQDSEDEGPLPWGNYWIGRDNGRMGPLSLPLTPLPGTPSSGRPGGYYIHGCKKKYGTCSKGCVVVPPDARQAIEDAGGGIVSVSPSDPDLSPGSACSGGLCRI